MRNIKLVIAYDGTDFSGWQRQKNGNTIQAEVEKALSLICNNQITLHGAGRTDAGVHAEGMHAHFHTKSTLSNQKLLKGMNALLPGSIRILDAAEMAPDFHARFNAIAKTYRYTVYTGTLQMPAERLYTLHYTYQLAIEPMRTCLETITGTHDFSSFENSGSRHKEQRHGRGAIRTILKTSLCLPEPCLFQFYFTGDGFLRNMVRNLVGTILEVGRGRLTTTEFKEILTRCDRQSAGATAPAHGLTLVSVQYD